MTLGTLSLAPLIEVAPGAVEALLDRAFGADRHGRTAYRLRVDAKAIPPLSMAALDGDELAGTIQCWPVALDDVPMVMVGPVAVEPERQNTGVGRALMWAMLAAADSSQTPHADVLMMVGDPDYYAKFGFDASHTTGWRMPGPWEPYRLLARMTGDRARNLSGMLRQR